MANLITGIRILCGLLILVFPAFSPWFYGIYLLGGLSDAIDGTVARKTGKATPFGAKFDTIADTVFLVSVLVKMFFSVIVPKWLIIWIAVIFVIKMINIASGFIMFHEFVTEHIFLNRLTGVLVFFVPLLIGNASWQVTSVCCIVTCSVATIAAVVEGHLIRTGKNVHKR